MQKYLNFLNISGLDMRFSEPMFDTNIWKHKPFKKETIVIWDVENIGPAHLDKVVKCIYCNPNEMISVSKLSYGKKIYRRFNRYGVHNEISAKYKDTDNTIKRLLREKEDKYSHVILVTSDGDFSTDVNRLLLKNKKVTVICSYSVAKQLVTSIDINNSNCHIKFINLSKKD